MTHVVCLISDPERMLLGGTTVAALERALGGAARWLAPDQACELPVDHHHPTEIRARIEPSLSPPLPHDIVVLPAEGRASVCW